jgi:hypothetical protein
MCCPLRGMVLALLVCGYSTLVAASSDVVVGADSGVVRVEFDRWHLATLGVAASDKEWAKADADSNGLVTAAEQVAYEACCKFKKGFAMDEAELPDDDGARVCRTVEDVDTLIMDFEAKTLSADHTKEVLRQSLYELGIKRVQGDGNPYNTRQNCHPERADRRRQRSDTAALVRREVAGHSRSAWQGPGATVQG